MDQGIRTRLTRVVTYEGPASITRTLTWDGGQASFDAILLSTGADQIPIADGEQYELTLTEGY